MRKIIHHASRQLSFNFSKIVLKTEPVRNIGFSVKKHEEEKFVRFTSSREELDSSFYDYVQSRKLPRFSWK